MEILKIPIVDFLKYSLDSAYQQGFSWVMLLLARDADAEDIYQQVKRYWDSLHDLTGKNILFVFAGKLNKSSESNSLLWHEAKDYRALANPSIRFISDNIPTVPYDMYPRYTLKKFDRNELAVTHTRSITELRDFLNLSEKDIPSVVFIPTHIAARAEKVIVRLKHENIYQMIKGIFEDFEDTLKSLKKEQDDYNRINDQLIEIDENIECLQKGTNIQNGFKSVKNYLESRVRNAGDDILKTSLQNAIDKKMIDETQKFNRKTQKYLNQYIYLLKQYPTLEEECKVIESRIIDLEEKKRKLITEKFKMEKNVEILYSELKQLIVGKESPDLQQYTDGRDSIHLSDTQTYATSDELLMKFFTKETIEKEQFRIMKFENLQGNVNINVGGHQDNSYQCNNSKISLPDSIPSEIINQLAECLAQLVDSGELRGKDEKALQQILNEKESPNFWIKIKTFLETGANLTTIMQGAAVAVPMLNSILQNL